MDSENILIGHIIKEARKKKDLTLRDLEKLSGVSYSFIGAVERGNYKPSRDNIIAISEALEINPDILLVKAGYLPINGSYGEYQSGVDPQKVVRPSQLVRIPVLGVIKAGYDLYAEQQVIGYELIAEDTVKNGEYFYLMVKGESMVDEGIKEGFRVLVRHQDWVDGGKIGVVIVNGDEGTLKRVYYQDDHVVLVAANKNIAPRILKVTDVIIQGQVVKVEFDV